MRILVVASYNAGRFAPFVLEQAEALQRAGCVVEFFGIQGKGPLGYLRNLSPLKAAVRSFRPDLIHAHYGLSGLLATLQHIVPVVVTYHGSDLNDSRVLPFSRLAMRRVDRNIVVFRPTAHLPADFIVIPCGINPPTGREKLPENVFQQGRRHVLFAGAFANPVKDAPLAQDVVSRLKDVQLIELRGYTREQIYGLMLHADALLLTSKSEGSPQVVKESMACGIPIVSVNVGDVAERLQGLNGCFVSDSRAPQQLAALLSEALTFSGKTNGLASIQKQGLTNDSIAARLIAVYQQLLTT